MKVLLWVVASWMMVEMCRGVPSFVGTAREVGNPISQAPTSTQNKCRRETSAPWCAASMQNAASLTRGRIPPQVTYVDIQGNIACFPFCTDQPNYEIFFMGKCEQSVLDWLDKELPNGEVGPLKTSGNSCLYAIDFIQNGNNAWVNDLSLMLSLPAGAFSVSNNMATNMIEAFYKNPYQVGKLVLKSVTGYTNFPEVGFPEAMAMGMDMDGTEKISATTSRGMFVATSDLVNVNLPIPSTMDVASQPNYTTVLMSTGNSVNGNRATLVDEGEMTQGRRSYYEWGANAELNFQTNSPLGSFMYTLEPQPFAYQVHKSQRSVGNLLFGSYPGLPQSSPFKSLDASG